MITCTYACTAHAVPGASSRSSGSATSAGGSGGRKGGENVGDLGNLPRVLRHSIHVYPVYHFSETRAARCRPQSAPSDACKRRVDHTVAQRLRPPVRRHHSQRARCPALIATTARAAAPSRATAPRTLTPTAPAHQPLSSLYALQDCGHQSCPSNALFSQPFSRPRPLRTSAHSTRHWACGSAASLRTRRRRPHNRAPPCVLFVVLDSWARRVSWALFKPTAIIGEGAGRARAVAARCAGRDAAPASQDTAGAQ